VKERTGFSLVLYRVKQRVQTGLVTMVVLLNDSYEMKMDFALKRCPLQLIRKEKKKLCDNKVLFCRDNQSYLTIYHNYYVFEINFSLIVQSLIAFSDIESAVLLLIKKFCGKNDVFLLRFSISSISAMWFSYTVTCIP